MTFLSQFLLRLTCGLAIGMAIVSHDKVSSGYFRNNLYVTLGLATLATLILASNSPFAGMYAAAAAVLSFIGSVWLYETKVRSFLVFWPIACLSFFAAYFGLSTRYEIVVAADQAIELAMPVAKSLSKLHTISIVTSALVLGTTMAAMLLGHWYLNSPGMNLAPLRRLLRLMMLAVALQMLVSGLGLTMELPNHELDTFGILFLTIRWSFGLVGVLVLIWLAWQTLKIPNTQSATGILYVAVIGTFVGELTSLLLSAESLYPL